MVAALVSTYLQWIILSSLTGSPLGSLVAILVFWALVDRFTLGVLPDPLKVFVRWQRERRLKHLLRLNPHDRRARLELGELLVARKANAQAVDMLKPVLEHGDDDPQTLFTMGAACLGAGYREQGEKLFAHLREQRPDFRQGELDLVLGHARLAAKDAAGAKEALERFLAVRKGSVEGRVLLARAQSALGDDASAALTKDAAWAEYEAAPTFQQRKERLWAWRARPSRPLLYAAIAIVAAVVLFQVLGPVAAKLRPPDAPDAADDLGP